MLLQNLQNAILGPAVSGQVPQEAAVSAETTGFDVQHLALFDVDALDPVYAPGTGTPEIGDITTYDAQLMIRGLRGLNLIGGDVVEVSPSFDMSGNTALIAVTMMFAMICEILCLLAEVSASQG